MDPRHAALLTEIDPVELGQRVRAHRVARGLTQTDLAAGDMSVGYVSRIESGQRRPTASLLTKLAARLGTSLDELLVGTSTQVHDEARLAVDYAELALESGQADEAAARAAEGLALAEDAGLGDLADRARYLQSRAHEMQGAVDDAIAGLERVVAGASSPLLRLQATIALTRAHREAGDFSMAVETGEQGLRRLEGTPLADADEAVQLAVTVAAALHERGDTHQAVRLCRRAVEHAERLDSPEARAAAYWNASILECQGGAVREAVILAQRALALLGEGRSARNLARLRTQLATMQLRLDPPEVAEARHQLDRAAQDLAWCSAGPTDLARNQIGQARSLLLLGDAEPAREMAVRAHDVVRELAPVVAAAAKAVEGEAWAALGDPDTARATYAEGVRLLSGVDATHQAAQLWYELAELLDETGASDLARDAYRSAAAAAGLRSSVRSSRAATAGLLTS